jgi:hypothetical protein
MKLKRTTIAINRAVKKAVRTSQQHLVLTGVRTPTQCEFVPAALITLMQRRKLTIDCCKAMIGPLG